MYKQERRRENVGGCAPTVFAYTSAYLDPQQQGTATLSPQTVFEHRSLRPESQHRHQHSQELVLNHPFQSRSSRRRTVYGRQLVVRIQVDYAEWVL